MNGALRQFFRAVIIALITSASLWLALVSFSYAETISRFEVEMTVESDGQVLVTETITYDFGSAPRHGIYRNIKETHPQEPVSWFKERYVDYELLSIKRDSQPEPYVQQSYDGLSVRIGDANKTITGQHVYEISYLMKGAISTYESGPELYWNVTGGEWQVSMNEVFVKVRGGAGVLLEPEQECYVGVHSSTARCDKVFEANTGVFFNSTLSVGGQVTIAQKLTLPQAPQMIERINLLPLWLVVCVLWLVGLISWLWRWKYQYKTSRPVIAQYEPYRDFKPMFTGVLFDSRLDQRDITAGIVYLAEQSFLSIKQTKDKVLFLFETTDYELTLNRPVEEVETDFQKQLFKLFDLETVGQVVRLSSITKKQSKLTTNQKIISELRKAVKNDLQSSGYIEKRTFANLSKIFTSWTGAFIVFGFIAIPFFTMLNDMFGPISAVTLATVMSSLILFFVLGFERRTTLGYEAENHLMGFKLFLSVTDTERFRFHNAPEKNPQQFMEYLPYAIAFGVEEKWAKAFDGIQMDNPGWYQSTNGSAFNAVVLTSDLSSFSIALAGASAPKSSSGSGGGGFSGGGAGGGGGGSW